MPRRRPPSWIYACAIPFLAYFALLLYCDVRRPESEGLTPAFGRTLVVRGIEPGSAAARAGLRPGDAIVAVDGRPIGGQKMDWVAVTTNVQFDRPIVLDVRRAGVPARATLVLHHVAWTYWTTREALDLLLARAVQLVSLALGLLVLFRRPGDADARIGAWLLGAVSVFCVVLPFRIAAVWRSLWAPIGFALWLPFASSLLVGALLLTFFLLFPVRRVRSSALLVALWGPAVAAAAPFVRYQLAVVYDPGTAMGLWDGFWLLLVVSAGYLIATVATAVWSYRRLADETERRRLRVLFTGAMVGSVTAGAIVIGWWRTGGLALFGPAAMGWLVPLLLVVPVSFAYAILRHRLFDVRLIIRQGVRYALARRLLQSLVPAFLLAMLFDLYWHRAQPMGEVLAARTWVYLVLSLGALIAQFERQRWLVALDRRFFRDRYDAQRLLREVADHIRDAGSIERVAWPVVTQIQLALHARFVALLVRAPGSDACRLLAAAPAGAGPDRFPADGKLLAVARLLGRPLEISTRETGWLAEQLPEDEVRVVREAGVELLVPIAGGPGAPEAFIALGARQSEEPYAREDQDLLQAIAGTLGLLLARREGPGPGASLRECPRCGACYDEGMAACELEAAALVQVPLPRVLVARYRLDRRLGRGGMGTVYAASDLALQRPVAVKVLREDLAGDLEAADRFEREARVAAAFSHPNVVTIHDYGITASGRGFLVMELLDGRTLRAEMEQEGALPPERALHVLRGVCGAVDAAHRRRLVHRDLKPENVFLASLEGLEAAKVLDFGIAKAFQAAGGERRQTAMGVLVGTPEYMAPEQLRGEEVSPSCDLWALGVMAYEMLTGRHPFSTMVGPASPAIPASHQVLLSDALAGRNPALAGLFASALAIDPGQRPPTAAAFLDRIERALKA